MAATVVVRSFSMLNLFLLEGYLSGVCSLLTSMPQIIFSELRILLEHPSSLFKVDIGISPFGQSLRTFSHSLFTLDKAPLTLVPRTSFLTCRRQAMGLSHLMLAAGYRWLPLAAENHRNFGRLRLWW